MSMENDSIAQKLILDLIRAAGRWNNFPEGFLYYGILFLLPRAMQVNRKLHSHLFPDEAGALLYLWWD